MCGPQQVAGSVESISESSLDVLSGKVVSEVRIKVIEKWDMDIGSYLKIRIIQNSDQQKNQHPTNREHHKALKLVGGCWLKPINIMDQIIVAPSSQHRHPDKTIIYAETMAVQNFGDSKTKEVWRLDIKQKSSCRDPEIKWKNG